MKFNKDYLFTQKEINMMSLSKMTPRFIAIHNTANTAPAINEAKNQFNNNTKKGDNGVAVHFYVDEKETYQLLPLDIHGWHASDGGTGDGNMRSIAIEICRSKDYTTDNYAKAELRTVELVKYLMKQFNIPIKNVKRHYDFDFTYRKRCPHRMFEASPNTWEKFLEMVAGAEVKPSPEQKPKPNGLDPAYVGLDTETVARQVINGEWYTGQARIESLTKYGYNHQTIQNRVNEILYGQPKPKPTPQKKTVSQLADEVNLGKWGNGDDRRKRLEAAGYSYQAVQDEINRRLYGTKPQVAKKSAKEIAREIVYGVNGVNPWGNGADRIAKLKKAGYNPDLVQAEVNKIV